MTVHYLVTLRMTEYLGCFQFLIITHHAAKTTLTDAPFWQFLDTLSPHLQCFIISGLECILESMAFYHHVSQVVFVMYKSLTPSGNSEKALASIHFRLGEMLSLHSCVCTSGICDFR